MMSPHAWPGKAGDAPLLRLPGGVARLLLALAILLPAAGHADVPVLDAMRMTPGITPQRLWIFIHLLLFVFWLGADLGVVLAVRSAGRPGLSEEQCRRTLALGHAIDLAPRLAASLMLSVGGILSEYVGIEHPWWQMAAIIVLGPLWASLVLLAHAGFRHPFGQAAACWEDRLRRAVIVIVPLSVGWSWLGGRLAPAPYIGAKLLLFGLLMILGLRVRTLWHEVAGWRAAAPSVAGGRAAAVAARLNAVLPLMLFGWAALLAAALLGVMRPGAVPEAMPAVVGLLQGW
ncbi:MAG: hypothetical protein H3C57_08845 [Gammaproteobacteria bacterium]|nr:hypothetical protein [Gammaproteobacteria bacterium]